jgi:hypothetical protein
MKSIVVVTALGFAFAVGGCAQGRVEAPPSATPAAAPIPPGTPSAAAKSDPTATPAVETAKSGGEQTIRGELVDLACYLDHGAKGESHKACGTTCALKGLPIGILDKDDKITIVVGAHERAMNTELAGKMGTTVALTGKLVSRNGVQMIEVSKVE